jgi:hypothetical protein
MWDRLASRSHNPSVCWEQRRLFGAGARQRTGAGRFAMKGERRPGEAGSSPDRQVSLRAARRKAGTIWAAKGSRRRDRGDASRPASTPFQKRKAPKFGFNRAAIIARKSIFGLGVIRSSRGRYRYSESATLRIARSPSRCLEIHDSIAFSGRRRQPFARSSPAICVAVMPRACRRNASLSSASVHGRYRLSVWSMVF